MMSDAVLEAISGSALIDDATNAIIDKAIERAKGGLPSALFEEVALAAFRKLREVDENYYLRLDADWRVEKVIPHAVILRLFKITAPLPVGGGGAPSKADLLVALVNGKAELFRDDDDEFYATCPCDNPSGEGTHNETYLLRGVDFRRWASREFFNIYESSPGDSAFKDALETLEGFAAEGECRPVYLRYAMHENEVYVALHDDLARVVKITAKGWKVIAAADSPVRFRKSRNARALPYPVKSGELGTLWEHINPVDDETRVLVEAWLLEAMRGDFPFPVLEVSGEQGSAKSTFQKRICALIDPAKVMLRREPKEIADYFVSARHNHVLCYDNMSNLTAGEQDALCTMSTGGGFATRRLHTTSEEEMWDAKRPVIIGGISELATQADLADRVIAVELPIIKTYKQEQGLEDAWARDYPAILGGLYARMSQTLAKLSSTVVPNPPRLADFAHLGQSMLAGIGDARNFIEVFTRNRNRVVNRAIESSPVAQAIVSLMDKVPSYYDTTAALLTELTNNHRPIFYDKQGWPRSPKGLGGTLRRLAPALRVRGIFVEHEKSREGWKVKISQAQSVPVPESASEPDKRGLSDWLTALYDSDLKIVVLYSGTLLRADSQDKSLVKLFEEKIDNEWSRIRALIQADIKRAKAYGEAVRQEYDCPSLLKLLEAVDGV